MSSFKESSSSEHPESLQLILLCCVHFPALIESKILEALHTRRKIHEQLLNQLVFVKQRMDDRLDMCAQYPEYELHQEKMRAAVLSMIEQHKQFIVENKEEMTYLRQLLKKYPSVQN